MVEGLWQYPRPTYFMEEKIANLEADMREQLEGIRREMKEAIIKTQQDTMRELTDMMQSLLMQAAKGKSIVDVTMPDSEYPAIPVSRSLSSSDPQPRHMQGNVPTPAILIRPSDLVRPPVHEDKIIPMVPYTLGEASHGQLVHNLNSPTGLIRTKERMGAELRNRREEGEDSSKRGYKKKERDAAKGQSSLKKNQRKESGNQSFTPLSLTYKELYAQLHQADVVRPYPAVPWNPPFPEWYNPNASCEYHSNVSGHLIENCAAFKKLVQGLIRKGVIKVGEGNTSINLLPNY